MKYIFETIKFYDDNVDEYYKNTINLQETNWINKFLSYIWENSTILDLGCWFWRDTNLFQKKWCNAYWIDFSKNMINKAKWLYPKCHFYAMNMLKLEFESNFFHWVWANASLLHLNKKDINLALLEIDRVLKSKWIIYILLKEWNWEGVTNDDRYNKSKKFYSYYTQDELKGIINKLNYEILDFSINVEKTDDYSDKWKLYLIARKN